MSDQEGSDEEDAGTERGDNLSALAKDAAHPFDQTNGIVDGLEGDADDPEQVDARLGEGKRATPLVAPPGSGGGMPIDVGIERDDARSDDSDDETERS